MRIAVPSKAGMVCPVLSEAEAVCFFEDDHGKLVRSYCLPAQGFSSVLALLEQESIDALLCGAVGAEERKELTLAGLMTFPGWSGAAGDAVRGFLGGAIHSDPANACNACGHKDACAACTLLPDKRTGCTG